MFENETAEQRDRRLGRMTREQKRGVLLFTTLWMSLVASVVAVPTGLLIAIGTVFGK